MMTQRLFQYASTMKPTENRLKILNEALRFAAIQSIRTKENALMSLKHDLSSSLKSNMTLASTDFAQTIGLLNAYSPLSVLQRGYSITKVEGKAIKSIKEVSINDRVITRLNDGEIESIITKKESYGKEKL